MIEYPVTQKVDVVDQYHGTTVADPFRWLEDTESTETAAWVQRQNALTTDYLSGLSGRDAIRDRLSRLWDYVRYGSREHPAPLVAGGRLFFFRTDGLQDQPVLYVQEGADGTPRVLLDPNTLSDDGTVAVSQLDVTRDGSLLAYSVSSGGSDWQEIRVRDVETGRDLPDRVEWVKFSSPSWTHDGKGFFYSDYPPPEGGERLLGANRGQRLRYHRLGTDPALDPVVYRRPDQPEWGFQAAVSDDGRYAFVHVWHGTAPQNRLFYIDLEDPLRPAVDGAVVELLPRGDASYVAAGNQGRTVFVLTDLDAPRRRVVAVDLDCPDPGAWRTVVPQGRDVVESARVLGGRLVLTCLEDAHSALKVFGLDGEETGRGDLPALGSVAGVDGSADEPEIFFAFTSFLHPTTVFRHDLDRAETAAFGPPGLDVDTTRFETRQVFYTSADGTRVPMFVTARRDLEPTGDHPVLLYGYGGFNVSLSPFFSVPNLVWLEMGGVLAVPNLRGGGEYGEDWHQAGTRERKQNVFDDFVAAAEHLVDVGLTRPERLAISGGSNGGLLVGACMIQRPDLFAVALPAVGVMDMLRFHLFTIGWAWVSDYGSAEDPDDFPVLHAYSPLHNLRDGTCYPATLVTTADHDDRVVPGHSFKFTARLQEAQGCGRPALIRVDVRAGHGAGKPTRMQIDEAADRIAFTRANLGPPSRECPGPAA